MWQDYLFRFSLLSHAVKELDPQFVYLNKEKEIVAYHSKINKEKTNNKKNATNKQQKEANSSEK